MEYRTSRIVESIKRARKALGLSLTDVTNLSGLSRVTIAEAERAGVDPRGSTIARIAKALGVPVCRLFEETGHERRRAKRARKR
jgi:transcriptional regulator with XRE-family HTH domain